jgi:hypothetical protein
MWRRVCKEANFPGVIFHIVRHSLASWHVHAETHIKLLQELGGWATRCQSGKSVAQRAWIARRSAKSGVNRARPRRWRQIPPPWPPVPTAARVETSVPALPQHARSTCEGHREWIEAQVRLWGNAMAICQEPVDGHVSIPATWLLVPKGHRNHPSCNGPRKSRLSLHLAAVVRF